MDSSPADDGLDGWPHPDPKTAARMLEEAKRVDARTQELVAQNLQSARSKWKPAVFFTYIATFLLVFTGPLGHLGISDAYAGRLCATLLILPMLMYTLLIQGANHRESASAVIVLKGRKLVSVLFAVLLFAALPTASMLGIAIPWWMCLVTAALIVLPMAASTLAGRRRTGNQVQQSRRAWNLAPLNLRTRLGTLAAALYLGIAIFSLYFSWFALAQFVMSMLMLALVILGASSRGLVKLGAHWRDQEWFAFGLSFFLYQLSMLVAIRTTWDSPVVGVVSAIVVALPMALGALLSKQRS
ncbi:hypothetical protein CQ010_05345 [Arthrobacter sp. MYb211]|nr:hypothetical protein CIK76_17345 [Glutamicibacter sp. BW80]PRC09331.1 hypothetical protein CQ010_05345 [Arthrobacter sp. MYb211]